MNRTDWLVDRWAKRLLPTISGLMGGFLDVKNGL